MSAGKIRKTAPTQSFTKIRESIKQIQEELTKLKHSPEDIARATLLIKQALNLPSTAFEEQPTQPQKNDPSMRRTMGEILRRAAEKEGCDYDFHPPHGFFGCVNIFEKQPNTWQLSVLDDIPIATLETVSGDILANAALEIIHSIEEILEKTKSLAKSFEIAYQVLQNPTQFKSVSPNLLMLLLSSDKSLKAHLVSSSDDFRTSLSRVQMGYLLKAFKQGHGLDIPLEISFSGATQYSTKSPHLHLSIPSLINPRKHPQATPISTVVMEAQPK